MASVLIVDNDGFTARLVRMKVEQLGHEVETAGDILDRADAPHA